MDGEAAAMRAFFEKNSLPLWVFELATLRFLAVNDAAVATYGYSREEFLAMTIADIRPEEERARLAAVPRGQGGSGVSRGWHHRLRSGELRDVDVAWCEVDWEGRPARLVLVIDVTAERAAQRAAERAQAQLELASRVARLGAWTIHHLEGRVELSLQSRELLALPSGPPPPLERLGDFFAPEDTPRLREAWERCVAEGVPFDCEVLAAPTVGGRLWVRILGKPERDASGAVTRVHGTIQDIDARRRAELAAAAAARDLANTLEHLTDGFITLDGQWRVTYANPGAERLLRRPRARLLGSALWDEVSARGTELERELVRAKAGGLAASFEVYHEPLACWLDVRAWPAGALLAVHLADSSARHPQQATHLESEARVREFTSVLSDALWDWDLATDTIWWSDALTTHFGFAPGALPTEAAWRARVHPDDRARIVEGLRRVIDGGGSHWLGEYRFEGPTGQWLTVVERGSVVRHADGHAVRMFGALTDVTRRREADAQLREQATLLDHAQDAIVVRDLQHRVRYWNRAAERRYGWSRAEALGQDVRALVYAEPDRQAFEDATATVLERGEWAGELAQRTRDGRAVFVEARWTLLRNDQGEPTAVLSINTDVTERKTLEKKFLRAQRLESLGTLAGGIAHDLNNVLAPILMTASTLQADEADPERLEALGDIHRAAQRGADIVKQLLSFARGSENRRAPLDLRRIASELRQMVTETFPKDIKLVLEVAAEPCMVEADATQIHQVLTNLCVNARDAMAHGGTLTIGLDRVSLDEVYAEMNHEAHPGRWVLLRVEDTGTGMPAHVLEHAFEPFFTTKDAGRGTGLGLSTVQAIVRRHGGFVRLESDEGRGTRFKIYLPQVVDADDEPRELSSPTPLPRGLGQLVLVVDDEAPIRAVARRTLERFGYRALLAANGAEAVALYAQHRDEVAVVLTDLTMPVMDGAATIVALRSLNPRVRIIASSGDAMATPVARVAELGAAHFVAKPYTAEVLLTALRDALTAPT